MPMRSMSLTSSATDFTRNFRMALARCTFTVTSLTPRSAAICLFRPPEATRITTSRSRWLSDLKFSRNVECEFLLRAPRTVLFQGGGNGVEEILVTKGLGEEVDGAGFHGAHRHGNISMAGEENDRYGNFGLRQLFLTFETTHSRETHIEDEAARRAVVFAFEEAFSRTEKLDLEPDQLEKLLQRGAQRGIVVDHENR